MDNNTIILLITTIGSATIGAILTALLQPLWTTYIEKKRHLTVSMKITETDIPIFIKEAIREYLMDFRNRAKLTDESRRKFQYFSEAKFCYEVLIKNSSQKKIENVVVKFNERHPLILDVESDELKINTHLGTLFEIGSVRPNSIVKIKIWASDKIGKFLSDAVEDAITVSADEYHKIVYSEEVSDLVKKKYHIIKIKSMNYFYYALSLIGSMLTALALISIMEYLQKNYI